MIATIFKAYDIRGIVDETLTEEVVEKIGRVLGSLALRQGCKKFCVGRDGRVSGQRLATALIKGVQSTGVDVFNLGMVPTPVLYFATQYFQTGTGVSVTGSHNPPQYNGLKMMINGHTLFGENIQEIYRRVLAQEWITADQWGNVQRVDAVTPYLEKITSTVTLQRPMRIAVDAGNGVAGPTARKLLRAMGCRIYPLYMNVDGTFPNHHPDPSKPANLSDLIAVTKTSSAEVGIAFDGDGDRLGVVTKSGKIIYPDRQMMLFAADILQQHPGAPIVYDVKCTRALIPWIQRHGGEPVISRTGHSFVKLKLRETKAPFAGEMSGHLFFNDERWFGFDDGIYAGARLLEILSRTSDISSLLEALPETYSTPRLQVAVPEGKNHEIVSYLQDTMFFRDACTHCKIDGLRVEWADGFALIRASNTTPVLVLRFEGDTPEALERIREEFCQALKRLVPDLELSF